MEVVRYANIGPYGIQHVCTREITLDGKLIPAGTLIQGMYTEILKGEYWNDGENFRPERFLDVSGKLKKYEHFVPFSMGKRKCLGEALAKTEMFLFFTNLVHQYTFLPEIEGKFPSENYSPGLTSLPLPFKARLVKRF